jgi:hypothetical protein
MCGPHHVWLFPMLSVKKIQALFTFMYSTLFSANIQYTFAVKIVIYLYL